MNKRKSIFSALMSIIMVLGLVLSTFSGGNSLVSAEEARFEPGTYKGVSEEGFGGEVEATVTVNEDEIEEIVISAEGETPEIGGSAMNDIADEIVATQSLSVDAVSGATVSSEALLAAVAAALTEAGADLDALAEAPAEEASEEPVEVEDLTTDVVVVGAGGAGLAAALEVVDGGKDVILLEAMPMVGGNTLRATGGLNAAETSVQEELGIEDSTDIHFEDTLRGGHDLNDKELVRVMVDNAADAVDWLNELGAELNDVSFSGGQTNARIHKPLDGSAVGPVIVRVLSEALAERGVEAMLETEAVQLLQDDSGKIVGVVAEDKDGNQFNVNAEAVILATGGFGANMDMVEEYDPELVGFETTNHPGAQGQGIQMALEVGAALYQIDEIQIHPTTQPGTGKLYTEGLRGDGAILVNKEGERFIDELQTRDVVSQAILEQTDGEAYLIVNQELVDMNASMAGYINQGDAVEAETIEDLAVELDVDPETLAATLDTYNAAQESGEDAEFGRANMTMNLSEGPYYALTVTPSIHHTMGGLRIDTSTHVLDEDENIIPGLYAAGEVTGGVHGGNRIGGNAVTDIIVFGRIAGQTAVAELDGAVAEPEAEEAAEETEEVEEDAETEEAEETEADEEDASADEGASEDSEEAEEESGENGEEETSEVEEESDAEESSDPESSEEEESSDE